MRLTITIPLPDPCLSPNSRKHWRVKAKATATYRMLAKLAALNAICGEIGADEMGWETANVQCRFFWPDKRRRDRDNAQSSMKSALDGITDARLWHDDVGVTTLPTMMDYDKDRPRVEITISKGET